MTVVELEGGRALYGGLEVARGVTQPAHGVDPGRHLVPAQPQRLPQPTPRYSPTYPLPWEGTGRDPP